jgi:hypothetical protein
MRIVVYQRATEDMRFVRLAHCANRKQVVRRVEGGPAGSAEDAPATREHL